MDKLKERIENTLNIPVLDELDVLTPPCVTLDPYLESPMIMGDGKVEKRSCSIQATIWAQERKEIVRLKNLLRPVIEENYTAPEVSFGSDPDTNMYRAIFDFQAWEENENEDKQEGVSD